MGRLEPQTRSMVERDVVADLHAALIRLPEDPALASLVADLRETSPRFAELWETTPARVRGAQRKTLDHPVVGRMTVDCDVLSVHGSDLQIVVFSAEPGTPDADALSMAIMIGLRGHLRRLISAPTCTVCTPSSASRSSASSSTSRTAMFSSRCATELVPGMSSRRSYCASSHASATWLGVTPCFVGDGADVRVGGQRLGTAAAEGGAEREVRARRRHRARGTARARRRRCGPGC